MLAEINALKERVQRDPKDIEAWARLANLYQDSGMFEPAIAFYQRALEIHGRADRLLLHRHRGRRQLRKTHARNLR